MHHLSHVRNLAAHHSRLWNRRLTFTMSIPRRPHDIAVLFNPGSDRYIYNTLAMLGVLVNLMSPGTTWPARLRKLIEENNLVQPAIMGFPTNWKELSIWSDRP
jgi:abortive infection bacteriophage resistance protein